MYLGLLATAAVADMPVGAPLPFASALEQAPDGMRTSEARPGSAVRRLPSTSRSRRRFDNPQKEVDLTPVLRHRRAKAADAVRERELPLLPQST